MMDVSFVMALLSVRPYVSFHHSLPLSRRKGARYDARRQLRVRLNNPEAEGEAEAADAGCDARPWFSYFYSLGSDMG